jgi:hypothetical protein
MVMHDNYPLDILLHPTIIHNSNGRVGQIHITTNLRKYRLTKSHILTIHIHCVLFDCIDR